MAGSNELPGTGTGTGNGSADDCDLSSRAPPQSIGSPGAYNDAVGIVVTY